MRREFSGGAMLAGVVALVAGCGSGPASRSPSSDRRTGCPAAPTAPVAPGGYYVDGNTVCAADGRPHLFHGVDRPSLEWSNGGEALLAADFRQMASWKANVVRVALNQDFWLSGSPLYDAGYPLLVDSVVSWAEAAGLDVILDLHWSDRGTLGGCLPTSGCQQKMADRHSLTFWAEVAARYAGDGRVVFELYNEPHDVNWDVWLSGGDTGEGWQAVGMQQLYDAVRGAGADNLVIAGGLDWGYDLSGVPQHRVAGYNVLYATHPYGSGAERRSRFWDVYWGSLTATDPVVVTEFGDTTTCADDYARELVDYADAHAAGWTAWGWIPRGCSFPSLLTDWTGTPSALGATIRGALARYDDDPAASAPPGRDATPMGGGGLTFAFERSGEGWRLDDFHDPRLTNLGAGPATGGAAPALTFAATDGDASPGALRLAATFTAFDQYAQATVTFGSPGLDLTGKTLRARVRLVSGPLVGGVQLAAFSGAAYDEVDGPLLDARSLPAGVWVSLDLALERAAAAPFDPSKVFAVAVRLRSGASTTSGAPAPAAGGETVIEIDGVED